MAGPRTLLLALLVVILCLTDVADAKRKRPCKYNKQKFKAGQVIEALADNCVELKCSSKGKKIELNLIKGCDCGGKVTAGPVKPTVGPVKPTVGPVKPTVGPVKPTVGPVKPTVGPVKPTVGPVKPGCNCDYSKFSSSHTMNKYSRPDAVCGAFKKIGVTDDEIKTILKTHNDLREKVAKGLETLGSPGPQPGATNMYELKWNCELAEVAQRWAERCKLGHDSYDARKICNQDYYVGQNAYMAWSYDPKSVWEGASKGWYNEVKDMPKSLVDKFGSPSSGKTVGHYTQVVWAETFEIGCGAIHFPSGKYPESKVYVCNYGKGGNMSGAKIYEIGKAASNCPNGVSPNYSGLCAPPK